MKKATIIKGASYSDSEVQVLLKADKRRPLTSDELFSLAAIKNEFGATLVDLEPFDQRGIVTVKKCKICGADYYGGPESEYCSIDCLSEHVRQIAGDNPSKKRRKYLREQCRATYAGAEACSSASPTTLRDHKVELLELLKLPFVMVQLPTFSEPLFFCADEATKRTLIAGADEWTIRTASNRVNGCSDPVAPFFCEREIFFGIWCNRLLLNALV